MTCCLIAGSVYIVVSSHTPLTLSEIEQAHEKRIEQYFEAYYHNRITGAEKERLNDQSRTRVKMELLNSPTAAWEKLGSHDSDTPETRAEVKAAVMDLIESTDTNPIRRAYEVRFGVLWDLLEVKPQITCSEPLPLVDAFYLSIAEKGYLTGKAVKENVQSWVFVLLADGEPFETLAMTRDKAGEYYAVTDWIKGQYPYGSDASRKAIHALMKTPNCYLLAAWESLDYESVEYLILDEDRIQSKTVMHSLTSDTKSSMLGKKEIAVYYRAAVLRELDALQYDMEHPSAGQYELFGTGYYYRPLLEIGDYYAQARFELFVKPYLVAGILISAGVIFLSTVIVLIAAHRKSKSKEDAHV